MNEEKIKEVLSDEKFVNSLMAMETPEEVQEALAQKDIALSVDEIKKIAKLLQKKADGELSDEDLEDVAGGSIAAGILIGIIVGIPTVAGACVVHRETRRRW